MVVSCLLRPYNYIVKMSHNVSIYGLVGYIYYSKAILLSNIGYTKSYTNIESHWYNDASPSLMEVLLFSCHLTLMPSLFLL